jgi:hydrogenase maturation protein HypF
MERLPYDRETTTMDDFPLCPFCKGEYTDPGNRRYHAQTVSCHECGPRARWRPGAENPDGYSGSRGPRARWRPGAGARAAATQKKPSDGAKGAFSLKSDADIAAAIAALGDGAVIALKGVGGYYFVCSPFDEDAVRRLRDVKVREHKPFAVMFASVEQARAYCEVSEEEEALLTSPKRPIVLLECVKGAYNLTHSASGPPAAPTGSAPPPFATGTLSTSRFVGAFLPSMALQYLLLDALGPLIMTSANIAGLPIIKDDDEMFAAIKRDERIAGILYNERRIVRRLDDSVTRVIDGTPQLIRRSKGWTPVPVYIRGTDRLSKNDQVFAAGADLKSAFALTKGSFVYLSQYIGDMDNLETEKVYEENLASMRKFFGIEPRLIAYDPHPLYRTSDLAKECVKGTYHLTHPASWPPAAPDGSAPPSFASGGSADVELLPVQHHHAHIASVMAEHGLAGPVIGVAFDGTGYGTDGTIWGGEILLCEGAALERFSHLRAIDMIGGDASMRDGWKSAVCHRLDHTARDPARSGSGPSPSCDVAAHEYRPDTAPASDGSRHSGQPADGFGERGSDSIRDIAQVPGGKSGLSHSFDIDLSYIVNYADENNTLAHYEGESKAIEAAVRKGVNTVRTSSMGRLFDAVASLLGIHHENRYEGECAVMLENAAARALQAATGTAETAARTPQANSGEPSEADRLALRFHLDIAQATLNECRNARAASGTEKVCLSGGVFQNEILTEETLRLLRKDGFTPYYNIIAPPNDGGIALGQAYVAMRRAVKMKIATKS